MLSRKLLDSDPSKATKLPDPAYPNFRMGDYGYGKNGIKIFQLQKDGPVHNIIEYNLNIHARLATHTEYYNSDNTNIVGSDVMATTAYIYAQKYGLKTPEEFALNLTQHLLDTFPSLTEANVFVEEMSWARLGENESQGLFKNKPHNHAFLQNLNGRRYCEVVRKRGDPKPLLIGGILELCMLKSGRAPFVGYIKSKLQTEGDNPDRILSIACNAKWEYKTIEGINFATHWHRVRDLIIHGFVGDGDGKDITSVQFFSYSAEVEVLEAIPEICSVSIDLKNIPYVPYNFSQFPPFEPKADVVIVQPVYEPHSVAFALTDRLENSKL